MNQSKFVAKSVLIVVIVGIASRLLGFVREMLVASQFGSGVQTDTYFVALTATGLFTSLLTHSLSATLIPVISDIEKNEGKTEKRRLLNNFINIFLIIAFILFICIWISAPIIIKIVAQGFEGEQFRLAVELTRIGLPVFFFAVFMGVYKGFLQSELMFKESSVAEFAFNISYIFYLLFLSSRFGIKGLMVTSVIAIASQILLQIPGLKKLNYKYQLVLDFKDVYIRRMLYLIGPVLVSVAVNDLNLIVDRSLASLLVDGSISALNYASRINGLTLSVFITALSTVMFPILSKEALNKDHEQLKKMIITGINSIVILTIPISVGIIALSTPIVQLAFERGAFTSIATQMTSSALVFYSLGLLGMALRIFLDRVFYAIQDTKTPMVNGFVTVGLNIILNLILVRSMQLRGLALATSVATTLTSGYLIYSIIKKLGKTNIRESMSIGFKALLSSAVMGLAVSNMHQFLQSSGVESTLQQFMVLMICVLSGLATYISLMYLLKVKELNLMFKMLKEVINRKLK